MLFPERIPAASLVVLPDIKWSGAGNGTGLSQVRNHENIVTHESRKSNARFCSPPGLTALRTSAAHKNTPPHEREGNAAGKTSPGKDWRDPGSG